MHGRRALSERRQKQLLDVSHVCGILGTERFRLDLGLRNHVAQNVLNVVVHPCGQRMHTLTVRILLGGNGIVPSRIGERGWMDGDRF